MRENNKIELEQLKEIYRNCDAFMICSTQNQVVNYIPIMNMIDTKKNEKSNEVSIYNMTYSYPQKSNGKDKKLGRFHNNEWDENLNTILYNNELIKKCEKLNIKKENEILLNIELKRNYNEKSYKDKITGEIEDKKNIVWNMTGGQRSILLTVLKIIQESPKEQHHTVIYMEGNTNRLIVGDYNEKTVGDLKTVIKENFKEQSDDLINKIFYQNAENLFFKKDWTTPVEPKIPKTPLIKIIGMVAAVLALIGLGGVVIDKISEAKDTGLNK